MNYHSKYNYLEVSQQGSVIDLWLNRPERHNALNLAMINEVIRFCNLIENDDQIKIVVLRGRGYSFCAGADLEWMKHSINLHPSDNLKECVNLSLFYKTIFDSPKTFIAMVHGNCFGGGVGLAAVCDILYTNHDARFSLSETRLGLVAATITPYLLKRVRPNILKELVLSARRFNGIEAASNGMANQSFDRQETAENHLNSIIEQISGNGPRALKESKRLINSLSDFSTYDAEIANIPHLLAQLRVSEEAREGFNAFLEKRKPIWP